MCPVGTLLSKTKFTVAPLITLSTQTSSMHIPNFDEIPCDSPKQKSASHSWIYPFYFLFPFHPVSHWVFLIQRPKILSNIFCWNLLTGHPTSKDPCPSWVPFHCDIVKYNHAISCFKILLWFPIPMRYSPNSLAWCGRFCWLSTPNTNDLSSTLLTESQFYSSNHTAMLGYVFQEC